jgi:uncharacterized membrane protein
MIQIIPNFHPVAVHFPIALTMVAFALALLSNLLKSHRLTGQWAAASHLVLWLAAASAVVAVVFGWLAFNSVNHDDAGHAAMQTHRIWAVSTALLLVMLALWDAKKHLITTILPAYFVVLLGVASASVGVTAWLGGEVVYRHGIGVLALPEPTMEEVGHEHGANAESHDAMSMDMPEKSAPAVTEAPVEQVEPAVHGANDGHKHKENP